MAPPARAVSNSRRSATPAASSRRTAGKAADCTGGGSGNGGGSAVEDRLRTLRPDVMERYDRLRAEGTDPIEAMRRVADAFDAPTVRTGQPAPVRAALPGRDRTRRPGVAEIVRYVGSTAAAPVAVGGYTYPAPAVGAGAAAEAPAAARSLTAAPTQAHRSAAATAVAGRTR